MSRCWAILTGAYPPAPGGVGDYTRVVARALAAAGDEVHVVTASGAIDDAPVRVHVIDGAFTMLGTQALDDMLDRLPAHRELLVQYTPYAFGARGFNLALPLWLRARASHERITVMFHEVMYPIRRDQPLRHNLLGRAHRWMASQVVRAAHRALVATPRWAEILRDSCGATCPIDWAPVPSNLPTRVDPARVASTRARFAKPDEPLIGHFGTYGASIAAMLEPVILDTRARVLLLGRGSREFRSRLVARHPTVSDRIPATGGLDATAAAEHLAACDVLVQPYPDGVTTRRGSVMAGLALGLPIITSAGELTEGLWAESRAVSLAPGPDKSSIIEHAGALIRDPARRRALSQRASTLYRDRFAVERTVQILRAAP